jgi:hypothetical protein
MQDERPQLDYKALVFHFNIRPMTLPRRPRNPSCVRASCLLIAFVASATHSFADVSKEKPVTMDKLEVKETKTHTLFMGADISINLDKDLYPVRDVKGSSWVVDINHQEKVISARQAPLNLKITPNLKLTEDSATITGFNRAPGYSYENDPSVRLTQELSRSSALNTDLTSIARDAQARADTMQNKALAGSAALAGSDDQFSFNAEFFAAQMRFAETHSLGVSKTGIPLPIASSVQPTLSDGGLGGAGLNINVGHAAAVANMDANQLQNGNEPAGKIATEGFDAMDIEFSITSPKPLLHPYVVTMTRFHDRKSKPGLIQNLVYAKSLDPIYSQISHVKFEEDGFPFYYELVDFQIHIYDGGKEVATNLAEDRVELTRDEAFEYVKSEYIGAHPNATLPPTPVMGNLPSDLPAKLNSGKYDATFYVKVGKDGLAMQTFADQACTQAINDPYLDTVVRRVRFKPALAAGRPVDGVTALNLNKLTI